MQWEEPTPTAPVAKAAPWKPASGDDMLSKLGFNMLSAGGFALGILLYLVGRLLNTIYYNNRIDATSPASSDKGLLHAASWIEYAALIFVVASLIFAAFSAKSAHWGARAVLLVLAITVLFAASGASVASMFGGLFGSLSGF